MDVECVPGEEGAKNELMKYERRNGEKKCDGRDANDEIEMDGMWRAGVLRLKYAAQGPAAAGGDAARRDQRLREEIMGWWRMIERPGWRVCGGREGDGGEGDRVCM